MNKQTVTTTQSALDHMLAVAFENGYQKGLYDGIIEGCRNSQNITHDASLSRFVQGKRIVATGNQDGLTAVDLQQYPGYEILSGPTRQEQETAVQRLNDLLTADGYNPLDFETAESYLYNSKYDPWTAYLDYRDSNGDSRDEALSAAERNA